MKKERNVEARIKNFTPMMDDLVKSYGIVTAAVWGRIWRYAQQENGVCQASQDKIADELGINRRTVIRHIKVLVDNDYLRDFTPNLRNKPHTYGITNKARILITVEAVTESHSKDDDGVTQSHTGVTQSHSQCDSVSHEETKKKQVKKQSSVIGVIPEPLQTPEFETAWEEWCKYRTEIKHTMTERTAAQQLKKLSMLPVGVAVAMIEQSIMQGWRGLFELKDQAGRGTGKEATRNADGSIYG
jgi:DNA-binding Lrp family transcriptional regulator